MNNGAHCERVIVEDRRRSSSGEMCRCTGDVRQSSAQIRRARRNLPYLLSQTVPEILPSHYNTTTAIRAFLRALRTET